MVLKQKKPQFPEALADLPGLEPEIPEPKSGVLPITP